MKPRYSNSRLDSLRSQHLGLRSGNSYLDRKANNQLLQFLTHGCCRCQLGTGYLPLSRLPQGNT